MTRLFLPLFCLVLMVMPLSAQAERRAATLSTTEQFCGCYHRFDPAKSKVAFKGRFDHFEEITTKEEVFKHSKVDLHFVIEDVYAGIPMGQQTMVVRTDTSSCGYGALFMPNDGTSLVGGTFLVFAESGYVDICNSVIGDETWAVKNVNPFIQHHPYRPAIPNFHRKLQQQEDDE